MSEKSTAYPEPISAEGIANEPMTLQQAADAIQASLTQPKPCSKCGEPGYQIIAKCRCDPVKEEIVIAISLQEIAGKLAGTNSKMWIVKNMLFIRIAKKDAELVK